jgi:hypothetical protein
MNCNIILYTLYSYLSSYSLKHPANTSIQGLSVGQTEPLTNSLQYCALSVCLRPPSSLLFFPTIHISRVHPPSTTRWLYTIIQVNNMGARCLIYKGHIYITSYQYTIFLLYFFHASEQAGWP